jgi:RNA recognition motif-containing protein
LTASGETYKLVAKISDPPNKQGRTGALAEGREVYVQNVEWFTKEHELKELFSSCGDVESVRIPTNLAGKSRGHGFVVFKDKVRSFTQLKSVVLTSATALC